MANCLPDIRVPKSEIARIDAANDFANEEGTGCCREAMEAIGSQSTLTPNGTLIDGISSPMTRAMAAVVSGRTFVRESISAEKYRRSS